MHRIKFLFILSAFLIIFSLQARFAYASDQEIQTPSFMEGFTSKFLLSINKFLFPNNLPPTPDQFIQVQPSSILTPIASPSAIETTPVLIYTVVQPQPTKTPTKTPTPIITITPSPTPTTQDSTAFNPPPGSLNPEKIFDLVNIHRQSMGLPVNIKNDRVCAVAQSRAPELANEFKTGNLHQGIKARKLPYWNHENIISTKSEQAAVDGWLSDDIHRKGIEGDYKYTCVACWTNKCVQEFTNLVNK